MIPRILARLEGGPCRRRTGWLYGQLVFLRFAARNAREQGLRDLFITIAKGVQKCSDDRGRRLRVGKGQRDFRGCFERLVNRNTRSQEFYEKRLAKYVSARQIRFRMTPIK